MPATIIFMENELFGTILCKLLHTDNSLFECSLLMGVKTGERHAFFVLSRDENILIRKADLEDITPACVLASEVFMEYDSADYGSEHINRMREALEDRLVHPKYYLPETSWKTPMELIF